MASGPDLFVVCKSCGSEVSPYITECPYCGTRLRKRAPKLEKGGIPKPPKAPRRAKPSLGRLRPGEIPGIRADHRAWGTIVLVAAAVVATLAWRAGAFGLGEVALAGQPLDGDYWLLVTTLFFYTATGYEIVALISVALFGFLLERRHALWAPLLVFLAGGAAGSGLAFAIDSAPLALGANGAALALLCAWVVPELRARRRGEETDADLLGVLAFAAVLALLPIATVEANAAAGLGGALVGGLFGLLFSRSTR